MATESRLERLERVYHQREAGSRSAQMQAELVTFLQEMHQTRLRDLEAVSGDPLMYASVAAIGGKRMARIQVVGVDQDVLIK